MAADVVGLKRNVPPKIHNIIDKQNAKLSHKKWRRLLQKEKRRVKRQQQAEERKKLEEQEKWRLENDTLYRARIEAKQRAEEKKRIQDEEERKRQVKLWLEREAQAQIAFAKLREREEKRERERIEQEKKIKEEWEEEQRLKKEKEEKKKQEIQDKENAVFKELEKPAEQTNEDQWHNPLAPTTTSQQQNYGTEQDTVNCSFYLKTGACRFGERCSRVHPRLQTSVTLMIPHMYQDIGLSQSMLDEADHDTGLEYDDEEAYERYKHFFEDVLPEFEKSGTVIQFKVCRNHEAHLRGNVYVQFSSEEECSQAFAAFNGRWYAGKQLSCEYSPVTKWRSAICGYFVRNRCPRGKNCNFMHVYRNPGNAFRSMDQSDLSPDRTPYSERESGRSTRDWRHGSRESKRCVRERSEHSRDESERHNSRRSERSRDKEYSRRRDHDHYHGNGHRGSDRRHSERYKEKDRSSPQRKDRFGCDVERSYGNSNKRSKDKKPFEYNDNKDRENRRSLSHDSSSSSHGDKESELRIQSDSEKELSVSRRHHRKKKHKQKHKKSKKKSKKRKHSASESDE